MKEVICNKCGSSQVSVFHKRYLMNNEQCWDCDRLDFMENKLELEEFEKRENKANVVLPKL